MSIEAASLHGEVAPPAEPVRGWRRWLRAAESGALVLSLALLTTIPLAEIVLRKLSFLASKLNDEPVNWGISAATSLVQHLCLISGMLGAAVAARENRLISLSTVTTFLHGRAREAARIFSGAFGAAVTFFLCVASVQFVLAERPGGNVLAYGIPIWAVQLVLPLCFAAITARTLRNSSESWRGRLIALLAAAVFCLAAWKLPLEPAKLVWPAMLLLAAAAVFGSPIYAILGGAALIFFWGDELPIASIPLDHYAMVTNPSLPTIPLFTLAGFFLAEGGSSRRLVRIFHALFGWLRGGPAIVTVLVCAFFTSFTGASGVTILALGGVLMPVLLAAKYKERDALGLLTGAGSIGLLFPPCLPLILYAIIAQISIEKMFLGGLLPGCVMVAMTAWWGIRQGSRSPEARAPLHWAEAGASLWEAKWELLVPVVAFVGLFGGFATPVEAAALTALYAFAVETLVYRDLKLVKDVPRVVIQCGLLVGGVLLILGVALGFTNYLVDAEIPSKALDWVRSSIQSKILFLLLLNLVLLIAGATMEIYGALVVVVPLIVPMAEAFGIHPVHLGIIFLANMELGFLMPPAGLNLLISAYRFNKPLPEMFRSIVPILLIQTAGVLLITYIPFLSTWLPDLFG